MGGRAGIGFPTALKIKYECVVLIVVSATNYRAAEPFAVNTFLNRRLGAIGVLCVTFDIASGVFLVFGFYCKLVVVVFFIIFIWRRCCSF